jgi:hypothetical protein
MRIAITSLLLLALIPILMTAHRSHGADDAAPATPPYDWKPLDAIIGVKGQFKDGVDTFTLPRNDLDVAVDSMEVPAAAGVQSEFRFFRCSCGKMRVVGQFCCADYETNDVIDAIRPGAILEVANVGPMFINDKPRVTIVRFQGEGDATTLAKLLKSALGWMGDARSATQPVHN